MQYFKGIVGQTNVKNYLSFQLNGFNSSGFFPPVLLTSKRGAGKTEIARRIKSNLINKETNKPKKFIEINGSSLKNADAFVDRAIIPYKDEQVTYFIDECHGMDKTVKNFLLSVLDIKNERKTSFIHNEIELHFDHCKQTFLFATTDPQALSPAFKTRCKQVDLEPYKCEEIAEIIVNSCAKFNISIEEDIQNDVASVARNTPRTAISLVDDIRQFCSIEKCDTIDRRKWNKFVNYLNIKPLGMSNSEVNVLKLLKQNGEMSLTAIANSLSLPKATVMGNVEPFLTEAGLIKINAKRHITSKGLDVIKNID